MLKEFKADQLTVQVYDNREDMGENAAAAVVGKINELLQKKQNVNVVFAAAPSQIELLQHLRNADVDWSKVTAFHMDEYIGLPANHPQRFGNFLEEQLFGRLPFRQVFYINGEAADIGAECQRYAELLQQYPADIVCMGIGENGHLAFNDPPVANFNDPSLVKIVELDNACRQQQVNDGCFAQFGDVPKKAITLTIPALMQAEFVCCVVPGERKAKAVFDTIYQPVQSNYPSTILRTHRNAVLSLDQQSSQQLGKN